MITIRIVQIPTILEDGQIQLREDTIYEENNLEIFRKHFRRVLEPDSDTSKENELINKIISVIWTPELIDIYKAKKAQIQLESFRGVK